MCGGLKFRIKWPDGINTYDYAPDLDYVVNFFDYPKGTKIYKVGEKEPLYIVGWILLERRAPPFYGKSN